MASEAERIAKGLVAAAQDALRMTADTGLCDRRSRMHDRMLHNLPAGLAVDEGDEDLADWRLTALGRKVAAALRAQENRDG